LRELHLLTYYSTANTKSLAYPASGIECNADFLKSQPHVATFLDCQHLHLSSIFLIIGGIFAVSITALGTVSSQQLNFFYST